MFEEYAKIERAGNNRAERPPHGGSGKVKINVQLEMKRNPHYASATHIVLAALLVLALTVLTAPASMAKKKKTSGGRRNTNTARTLGRIPPANANGNANTFPDLDRLNKADVPRLIKLLQFPDTLVRYQAARALGRMGAEAEDAVPALIEVMKGDRDADVRLTAAFVLRDIGVALDLRNMVAEVKDIVSALVEVLKRDLDSQVREAAIDALTRISRESVVKRTDMLSQLKEAYSALKDDPDKQGQARTSNGP